MKETTNIQSETNKANIQAGKKRTFADIKKPKDRLDEILKHMGYGDVEKSDLSLV